MDDFVRSIKKAALAVAGVVNLAIGIAGIILPLLPGTPFLILSALCFKWMTEV